MALAGSSVLIVDDNRELAEDVAEILLDQGAQVRVAASVSETLGMPLEVIDVGLIDVQLPDGTGMDLLRELKAKQPDCEVLLVTGHASVEDAARAVGSGAFGYVLKPFTPGGLVTSVAGAVRRVRTTRELRTKDEALRAAQRRESVSRLVEGVAHDFNNLLSVIRGYTKVIEKDLGHAERVRSHAESIHRCTTRGAALCRQLLSYGRRAAAEPRPISPNQIIEDLSTLWKHVLDPRIESVTELDAGLGLVLADVSQLEQVLMNLVINARDAMPRGGTLRITSSPETLDLEQGLALSVPPGTYARLSVIDTGEGMDEATRAKATQMFFSTKGERGTGLGLSTVISILREHGGGLAIESRPGEGTRIDAYLPLLTEAAACSEAPPAGEADVVERTVLLVEDEELLRMAARSFLEGDGRFTVLEAGSLAEARRLADEEAIDVLITDMRLPDGSGVELAEELRERFEGLDVLVTTALVDPEETKGFAVIRKPFEIEELPGLVHRLGGREDPAAGARPSLLVVEDDAAARGALTSLLEDSLEVVAAASAREAIEAVRRRQRPFDLLLTDLTLPDGDGASLARQVRELHPETRVVFASGREMDEVPPGARFLPKPLDFDALEELLLELSRTGPDAG